MRIADINKVKNKDYVVLLPSCDYDIKESVIYSFDNVFFIDYEPSDDEIKVLIDFINTKANQLVLFDYDNSYRKILPHIRKTKKVKWIFKNNIAQITNGQVRATFNNIMEFYDRNIVNTIGLLDYSTYEVLKSSGHRVCYLNLDIKRQKQKNIKSNSIGIIGNDYNPNHNIYNELSAIKMVDYSNIKLNINMPATSHFLDFFDIKYEKESNLDKILSNNFVNLYCNFTGNCNEVILKSMDLGIPCILGNTDIFDKYPKLKKYLVLDSDDDINEIKDKINLAKENKDDILKEYDKFRNKYTLDSKKQVEKFLK